jgi:hypothetical protein
MTLPEGAQQSSAISYFPPYLLGLSKDLFTAKPPRTLSNLVFIKSENADFMKSAAGGADRL